MTTPSKEGLKFSDEERRKAAEQLCNGGREAGAAFFGRHPHLSFSIAIDLQCRLNRAEELLGRGEHFGMDFFIHSTLLKDGLLMPRNWRRKLKQEMQRGNHEPEQRKCVASVPTNGSR